MNNFTTWSELFFNSLQSFSQQLMSTLPKVIGAVLILLIGWLFARIIARSISKLLHLVKFDLFAEKIRATDFLAKANVEIYPSRLVGQFVYWMLLLLVVTSATEALGWDAVSKEVSKLINYLPNLLIAIIFFLIGTYIAAFVRDIIKGASSSLGISTGKMISSLVYYLLFIIVSLTALEQGGIDTSIITSNLLIILGAVLFSAALSYGFASRDLLSNILAAFFSRRTFQVGQVIELKGVSGKIIAINNISITIQNEEGAIVIPAQMIINNMTKIKIIG